ncbi:UPF0149 family protein [Aliikangiella sp. G2MR2-5]|uniref:UPF0149 family protein n=1 Tax=Aliikangiella sp. G2MR2-5 TaxID=2788943 RepID=UPI0018ABC8DA|nr:UPF0149 family protein [Aliikangiella sp. G2MR2-5]
MPTIDLSTLENCFENQSVKDVFGSLYHSLGFITAVASAPEKVPAKEWMPQLCLNNEAGMDIEDSELAKTLSQGFVKWWHTCDLAFEHSHPLELPAALKLTAEGKPEIELVEFSTGYLDAYRWLSGSWQQLLPEENEQASRSVALLNIILAKFIDEEKIAREEPELAGQLPNMQDCLSSMPKLISAVGMLGKDLAQEQSAVHTSNDSDSSKIEPYINEQKSVGRNDPCICGSGKKFKKCCLH